MKKIILVLVVLFTIELLATSKSIKVDVVGKGTPVLLLPGFTCPGEVWNSTVEKISATHECHIVSYPGFGDVPAIESRWLETIKNDVESYVNSTGLKTVSIVGHSMGGTLALWLASEKKININKVMVVDGLPCLGALMIPNYSKESIKYDTPRNNSMLKMDDVAFATMAGNYANYMTNSSNKRPLIKEWIIKADRKTYVHGFTDLLKIDLRNDIASIDSEVLVLAAANMGRAMIESNYNKQFEKLRNKKIVYMEKSAHFIMFDAFDAYIGKLQSFLN